MLKTQALYRLILILPYQKTILATVPSFPLKNFWIKYLKGRKPHGLNKLNPCHAVSNGQPQLPHCIMVEERDVSFTHSLTTFWVATRM